MNIHGASLSSALADRGNSLRTEPPYTKDSTINRGWLFISLPRGMAYLSTKGG